MSYDIYLRGGIGDRADLPDPTYNLGPIFQLALTGEEPPKTGPCPGLSVLDGRTAKDTVPMLATALARIHCANCELRFLKLEPLNGWGNLAGARHVLRMLFNAAIDYELSVWEIK